MYRFYAEPHRECRGHEEKVITLLNVAPTAGSIHQKTGILRSADSALNDTRIARARASIPARFSSCHSEPPRRRIPGVEWARLTAARKDRDSSLRRLRSE